MSDSITTQPLSGCRLRLDFVSHADRLAQSLSLIRPGAAPISLLQSIEGAPAEAWPPSPPLQHLTLHELPDGRTAALLVGQAGQSHWSASIEPGADGSLLFDFACRHIAEPLWLGNRYQRLSESREAALAIEGTEVRATQTERMVVVEPRVAGPATTTRWSFAIRMVREGTEYQVLSTDH